MREIRTVLSPAVVLERLDEAARRGRMPGFHAEPGGFRIRVFGEAFERELDASVTADGEGSVLKLRLRLRPLMPIVFALIGVTTVWPGVWLTESMLETYYPPAQSWWPIWWWYVPLTVIPLPWAARSLWRKSQATASAEVSKTMSAIERELC